MFKKKEPRTGPWGPTEYPPGTFVKSEKGYFYIVAPGRRYRLISERVLNSWSPHRVVRTTEVALKNYRSVAKMKFRNGSLIYSLSDGKLYLIVQGKRCHITSPDALTRIGAVVDEAITVSKDEIDLHEPGEELN